MISYLKIVSLYTKDKVPLCTLKTGKIDIKVLAKLFSFRQNVKGLKLLFFVIVFVRKVQSAIICMWVPGNGLSFGQLPSGHLHQCMCFTAELLVQFTFRNMFHVAPISTPIPALPVTAGWGFSPSTYCHYLKRKWPCRALPTWPRYSFTESCE